MYRYSSFESRRDGGDVSPACRCYRVCVGVGGSLRRRNGDDRVVAERGGDPPSVFLVSLSRSLSHTRHPWEFKRKLSPGRPKALEFLRRWKSLSRGSSAGVLCRSAISRYRPASTTLIAFREKTLGNRRSGMPVPRLEIPNE